MNPTRRFEFNDATSHKFWEIRQDGCDLHVCFGRIGTAGQSQVKNHADSAKAGAAMDKLIREKTGKGYQETGSASAPVARTAPPAPPAKVAAPPAPASPPAPAPAPAPAPLPNGVAPWLAIAPLVEVPSRFRGQALPSRRFPGAAPASNAEACWNLFATYAQQHCAISVKKSMARYQDEVAEAAARIKQASMDGSPGSDAILLAVSIIVEDALNDRYGAPFVDFLVAQKGLTYALDALIATMRADYLPEQGEKAVWSITSTARNYYAARSAFNMTMRAFRAHLARTDQATWEQCAAMLRGALAQLAPHYHGSIALLLPEMPDLSNDVVRAMDADHMVNGDSWLLTTVDAADCIDKLHTLKPHGNEWMDRYLVYGDTAAVATIIQEFGEGAIERLRPGASLEDAGQALGAFGLPAAIDALARVRNTSKEATRRFAAAIQRWPLAAIAALSEALGPDLNSRDNASLRAGMAGLVHVHAELVPAFLPWLSPAAGRALEGVAAQYAAPVDLADPAELPSVLASPPWLRPARKAGAAMVLEPLPLPPSEHWTPAERAQVDKENRYSMYTYSWKTVTLPPGLDDPKAAIAAGDAQAVAAAWRQCRELGKLDIPDVHRICNLPDPLNVEVWNLLADLEMNAPGQALAKFGLRALPGLVAMCERRPSQDIGYAIHFAATELAMPAARLFFTVKKPEVRAQARSWLLAHPEHAACGLLPAALGKPGTLRQHARTCLRLIAAAGHGELLHGVAARYQQAAVEAGMRDILDEDPLDLHPAKIGKLPDFWQPYTWTRPVLTSNGKGLPDAALLHIGTMLRFPVAEEPYAGLAQIKAACTPESLAAFVWDGFCAWLMGGADSKESWAFTALGVFGNDDTARKLTPYLRAWPGEAQHARAVTGLDVLAQIGTDTALMLLNGIAQKVKFKGLQDKAREKIQQIAEARDLTTEELEDRLAPDLGLDEHGTLLLDFGPRQFRVGFDEALKPYVRDMEGARLPDLPKPKKTDDEALAGAAVERFKLLKKDARTIAAQQVARLEVAMCAQRRWLPEVFHAFLAGHPLVRHLVQRIVWASYQVEDGASHGGRLLACFRVAPDGSLTNADDDPFELPQGADICIGIPHALDLPPADAAAFGQLFADYELLQPFSQIGRDTYVLRADELAADKLLRWNGVVVPTGRVLGLANKGWRRGTPQDGGGIIDFTKALGGGRMIELQLDPGIIVGMVDEYPEQTLGAILTGTPHRWGGVQNPVALSTLDPIAASELIRDMENLRA